MELPRRKRNRISNYDYSNPGAYFITICTQNRRCLLGKIVGGDAFGAPHVQLSQCGKVVQKHIVAGNKIHGVCVDKYVIMPNHVHLILLVSEGYGCGTPRASSPTDAAIPHFVSVFKRFCHRDIGTKVFQRSYHDHVIRDEKDYQMIWQYIDTNPMRWKEDRFYMDDPRDVEGAIPYDPMNITPEECP